MEFTRETANHKTILALHLRVQRFGFAILRSQPQLLDWGIKTYRAVDAAQRARLMQKRMDPLLRLFRPDVVVAGHARRFNGPNREHIVRAIEEAVRGQSAKLVFLGEQEIQFAFKSAFATTKEQIAAHVALMFPELTWKLPPVRKAWESEHHNMPVFDAMAVGFTYSTLFRDSVSLQSEGPSA